jgi:phosphopantothenoylcysteine decarboxylase/phosphopantothenate--cysteine ligase
MSEIPKASVFIAAAAVSDYRPVDRAVTKMKKSDSGLVLTLEPTADILSEVAGSRRDGLLIVGFAAETDHVLEHAREKLRNKKLDVVVANDVSRKDAGFDTTTNAIAVISKDRQQALEFPLMSKLEAANRILDEIVRLRSK